MQQKRDISLYKQLAEQNMDSSTLEQLRQSWHRNMFQGMPYVMQLMASTVSQKPNTANQSPPVYQNNAMSVHELNTIPNLQGPKWTIVPQQSEVSGRIQGQQSNTNAPNQLSQTQGQQSITQAIQPNQQSYNPTQQRNQVGHSFMREDNYRNAARNRGGGMHGRGGFAGRDTRGPPVVTAKNPIANSRNEYCNGTKAYYRSDGPICFTCGEVGHPSNTCTAPFDTLNPSERAVLMKMAFGENYRPSQQQQEMGPSREQPVGQASAKAISAEYGWDNEDENAIDTQTCRTNFIKFAGTSTNLEKASDLSDSKEELSEDTQDGIRWFPQVAAAQHKRQRFEDIERPPVLPIDTEVENEVTRPKAAKPQKRMGKAVLPGLLVGHALDADNPGTPSQPQSVRQILLKARADVSLLDLAYWSPAITREMKRLVTQILKKKRVVTKKKPAATEEPEGPIARVSRAKAKELAPEYIICDSSGADKAFRLPSSIKVNGKIIQLNTNDVQADQGSDVNLVTEAFVRKFRLQSMPLNQAIFGNYMSI